MEKTKGRMSADENHGDIMGELKAIPSQSGPVDLVLSLPEGCFIDGLQLRHSPDCCSTEDDYQTMELEFVDGGGGGYCIIESGRWAADADDLTRLSSLVKTVVEHNDKLSGEEAEESLKKIAKRD